MRGDIINPVVFNNTNIKYAYALVSLAKRDLVTSSTEENLDSETLFAFLKLENHIPNTVFFTVELICPPNLAVLNSTVIKRSKANKELLKLSMHINERLRGMRASPTAEKTAPRTQGTFMLKRDNRKSILSVSTEPVVEEKKKKSSPKKQETEASSMSKRNALIQAQSGAGSKAAVSFWDATNSHHILPVFASGIAFVPASYDTIICQSFYNTLIPVLVESLVCGQGSKNIFSVKVPLNYVGMTFGDVFRAFGSRNILVLGIYRAPFEDDLSMLPFAYSCPKSSALMRTEDRLYVVASPLRLRKCLVTLELPLIEGVGEVSYFLGNIPSSY